MNIKGLTSLHTLKENCIVLKEIWDLSTMNLTIGSSGGLEYLMSQKPCQLELIYFEERDESPFTEDKILIYRKLLTHVKL